MGSLGWTQRPTAQSEGDRRRHPRNPTLYHLIMRVDGLTRIVSIENVSLGGVAVFSLDVPDPGTPVKLAFPKQQARRQFLLEVTGTVVRRAGLGVLGIAFDPGQERVIKQILRTLPALRVIHRKAKAKTPRRRPAQRRRPVKAHRSGNASKRLVRSKARPKPERRRRRI